MKDVPYVRHAGPETVAVMTRVCSAVAEVCRKHPNGGSILLGAQVLAGCNREALAIAYASGLDFIRAEGFVFAHVADEGIMESCAGDLLRYRRSISAQHVYVLSDIKKKHSSHSITSDVSIEDTAQAAEFFLSDGVIVTGSATGAPPAPDTVKSVKSSVRIPVIVGSGVTASNVKQFAAAGADAFIVGSDFKFGGDWRKRIDEERVHTFMKSLKDC